MEYRGLIVASAISIHVRSTIENIQQSSNALANENKNEKLFRLMNAHVVLL